jgi:hypothetical protein
MSKVATIVACLAVTVVFATCGKNGGDDSNSDEWDISEIANLCTDALTVKYLEIWKELFIQRNNLTETFCFQHVEIECSERSVPAIGDWNDGTSFGICYSVKIDWATAFVCDNFIININNTLYPALDVPRNVYLNKTEIEKVLNMRAFSSEINKLTSDKKLKFQSLEDALNFAIKQANVNTLRLSANGIFIDRATGRISLEAVESNYETNKCIFVTLDLINGQTTIVEASCIIH